MSLYQIVSWMSFLHLFVLAVLVLFKAKKHSAFRFFAFFLFSFSYVHLNHILVLHNKAAAMWMVNEIVFLAIFLLGPAFLQFVAEMLGEKINWQKYLYLHLIPFLFFLFYYSSFLFNNKNTLEKFYAEALHRQPLSNTILTSLAALQKGVYVYWSLLLLRRHFKKTRDHSLKWLFNATRGLLLLCFVIAPLMIVMADRKTDVLFIAMPVTTSILYLYFSFKILTHETQVEEKALEKVEQVIVADNLSRSFEGELEELLNIFEKEERKKISLNTELKQKIYDVKKSFRQLLNVLNDH